VILGFLWTRLSKLQSTQAVKQSPTTSVAQYNSGDNTHIPFQQTIMLIQESYKDVTTQDGGSMRIFTFHPQIPNYPKAKFPGVVVFSEIYQGKRTRCTKQKT
jgi:hypothetical protein